MNEVVERLGDWTETYTGVHFWSLDPREDEINIYDIAHALSNICRFNGHCKQFYSVSQHSVLAAEEAVEAGFDYDVQMAALMHDASEIYVCDLPRPFKPYLDNYKPIEEKLMNIIFGKYNIKTSYHDPRIKTIDNNLVRSEAARLMPSKGVEWDIPWTRDIQINRYWKPNEAEQMFLIKFEELYNKIDQEVNSN